MHSEQIWESRLEGGYGNAPGNFEIWYRNWLDCNARLVMVKRLVMFKKHCLSSSCSLCLLYNPWC